MSSLEILFINNKCHIFAKAAWKIWGNFALSQDLQSWPTSSITLVKFDFPMTGSHDWNLSEIPHPVLRSLLIHGGFCMETPDIATKEFYSKGVGVEKKSMGCSKPRALKGKTLCWNLHSGNDVVRCQFFRNCVQEMSRSFLSIIYASCGRRSWV